jgi:DNA-binding MarR family transcriptional regulator
VNPATSESDVTDDIAAIEAALTTLVRRMKLPENHTKIVAAAGVGLDRAAYVVLSRIGAWGPLRLSELAEKLAIDGSTASRHVQRLEADGYLTRTHDPSDRRAALLSLTGQGSDVVARIRRARIDALSEHLADWTPTDRGELARLLRRLADALVSDHVE